VDGVIQSSTFHMIVMMDDSEMYMLGMQLSLTRRQGKIVLSRMATRTLVRALQRRAATMKTAEKLQKLKRKERMIGEHHTIRRSWQPQDSSQADYDTHRLHIPSSQTPPQIRRWYMDLA